MSTSIKQSNYHFSFTIGVQAPQDSVWAVLTDVPTWHIWDTELKSAHLEGDFALGAKGVLTPKKGPELPFQISEIVPNQSYTFITKMPIGSLDIKRTLTHENGVTYFTDDIAFTGFMKHIFGLILGSGFRKILPEVMDNFKKIAEKS
jgi:Polyketide cyclase / dehydrase and lipid transport